MKKATVLAGAIALFGFISIDANAQTQPAEQQTTTATEQQATEQQATEQQATGQQTATTAKSDNKKEKISQDQLPEPVKQVLAQEAFQEWKVDEVYKVAGDAPEEKATYEVICVNSEQQKGIVRIDETGAVLKGEEKKVE